MSHIKVAVIQDAPAAFDINATMQKVRACAQEAASQGAQLVVFPEAFLGGYPKGADFGARVGMRSPEGRAWFARYWNGAVEVPGPVTDSLGQIAAHNKICIVMGAIERDGGTLYCSALYFASDGRLLGKHRKTMPTAMERLIWGFGDGSTLGVVETEIGQSSARLGAVICWENYMPLLRTTMYAQGIQLYCAPTVDDRDSWIPTMRHIASEGRCFVLSSCQFARRSDYPADYAPIQGNDPQTVLIRGGSCIVNPFGEVIAGPVYNEAAILTAEIDLDLITQGKYDLDVVGHYARPDIFHLTVNRSVQQAVEFRE